MADNKPPETPKVDARQAAINHLTKTKDEVITQYQGKLGYNPHVFVLHNITPLLSVLQNPKSTPEAVAESVKKAGEVKGTEEAVRLGHLPTEPQKVPKVPDAAK